MKNVIARLAAGAVAAAAVSTTVIAPASAATGTLMFREVLGATPNPVACPDNPRTNTAAPLSACSTDNRCLYSLGPVVFAGPVDRARSYFDDRTGQWAVSIDLAPSAKAALRDVSTRNIGKSLAYVAGGRVLTASKVTGPINSGGLEITGKGITEQRAKSVARALGGA